MFYLIIGVVVVFIGYLIVKLSSGGRKLRARQPIMVTVEANHDIIEQCLASFQPQAESHNYEREVLACIGRIADRENRYNLDPRAREFLLRREPERAAEFTELVLHLQERFRKRGQEIAEQRRAAATEKESAAAKRESEEKQAAEKRLDEYTQRVLQRHDDLVERFLEISERKVSVIDDYGDENWKILPKEIEICFEKIVRRGGVELGEHGDLHRVLTALFMKHHQAEKEKRASSINPDELSGAEFEVWLSKLLRENGFDDVRGTPTTGDQGADIIAKKDGRTIIVQAKRSRSPVGNGAVQEVVSAVLFYRGDEGWVITNSTFTPSAKALAQKAKIRLIDGEMLKNIEKHIK